MGVALLNWPGRLVAALVACGLVVGAATVAMAQPSVESLEGRCDGTFTRSVNVAQADNASEIPQAIRTGRLDPRERTYGHSFEQDRSVARLNMVFNSYPESLPLNSPAEPIRVEAELARDGVFYVNHAVTPSSALRGGALAVSLCIEPNHLAAGEYAGQLIVSDERLPAAAVPFTVTVQYHLVDNWVWWIMYVAAMMGVGLLAAWVIYLAAWRKQTGLPGGPGFLAFVRTNWVAPLFGFATLVGLLVTNYWRQTSWGGRGSDWLDLTIIVLPAVVGAISARVLYDTVTKPDHAGAGATPSTQAVHVTSAPEEAEHPSSGLESSGNATVDGFDHPDSLPVPSGSGPSPPTSGPSGAIADPAQSGSRSGVRIGLGLAAFVLLAVGLLAVSWMLPSPTAGVRDANVQVGGDEVADLIIDNDSSQIVGNDTPDVPAVTIPPGTLAEVPDIYGLPVEEGLRKLEEAGLVAFAFSVCSSSVETDHIRQVMMNEEEVLVDRDVPGGRELPAGSTVEVKVANGEAC